MGAKIIQGFSPSLYNAILSEQNMITEPKSGCNKINTTGRAITNKIFQIKVRSFRFALE